MCGCNNLTLLFVKIKQTGHKNIREQAASLETVAYTVWWRGASALWNQCSLQNIVIGSYICLPEWAFCFAYDYFHAYLKSRSRPQPRLQLWLHTPIHIWNFEIMSQRLSNWYWTIRLDLDIWDTCLWDTYWDPKCLKSIQTEFRPPRHVLRNEKEWLTVLVPIVVPSGATNSKFSSSLWRQ